MADKPSIAKIGCLGCGGLMVTFFALGVIGTFLGDDASDPSPAGATDTSALPPVEPIEVTPAYPAELDARVNFDGTQIKVVNRDDFAWTDCEVSINPGMFGGGWTQDVARISPGDSAVGGIMAFTDADARRFNPTTHAVESVDVICQTPDGSAAVWSGEW